MTTPEDSTAQLNIREKLAHIDQMFADTDRLRAETRNLAALRQAEVEQALTDIARGRQAMRLASWQLMATGMTAGAALFAAGAAFIKLLGG
ncbi:MAG TPA: hypothetical protein VE687_17045 [Stellaceae bacterium]|nr:hypothetical protein [Stellaceae bacterium]